MKKIILDYLENDKPFGLLLFSVPTGSGKTYGSLQAIYDYATKHFSSNKQTNKKGPIYFITNQKKNLPKELLKGIFKYNKKEELFNKLFFQVYPNSESVLIAIQKYGSKLINEIPTYINPVRVNAIKNYLNQANDLVILKNENIKQNIIDPIREKYIKQEEKKFREIIEPELRKNIKYIIRKRFKNEANFITAITNDKDWQWISKLYPTAYIYQKKIVMMSIDKFINPNTNLIDPSFNLYISDKLKNGTVIIDEFDASYEVILEKIISDNLKNQVDIVKLFIKIHDKLKNHEFINDLVKKDYGSNEDEIKDMLKRLTYDSQEIFKKFNLQYNLKSEFDEEDNIEQSEEKNLLYQSLDHISVYRKKKIKLLIKPIPKEKINKIIPIESKDLSKPEYKNYFLLEKLLQELQKFLNFFREVINRMAFNYLNQRNNIIKKKQAETFQPILSLENTLYTVLNEFDLEVKETSFLITDIQVKNKLKNPLLQNKKQNTDTDQNKEDIEITYDFDQSFHITGCKLATLIDSINHDTKTKPYTYTIPYTPEILLLAIAKSCKVIGISATATNPTIISNYDFDYIKNRLRENYHTINEEENKTLKENFEESIKNYKNPDGTDRIKIHTEIIEHPENYIIDIWENLYKDIQDKIKRKSLAQTLDNILKEAYSRYNIPIETRNQDYINLRYYRIAYVFAQFIRNKDIKSLLTFLNTHPKTETNAYINKYVLETIFEEILLIEKKLRRLNSEFNIKDNIVYLTSQNFEKNKKYFIDKLKNGEKIFLITTYQTLGAGQNCDYPIPKDLIDKLIKSNDYPSRSTKDFDAIYLEKPTNIIPNLTSREENPEEAALKYIIITERLRENGEINHKTATEHIKKAIRYLQNPKAPRKNYSERSIPSLLESKSAKFSATQILIQATGRICRTNMKSENIYIYADNNISRVLEPSVLNENQYNPEFISLVQTFKNRIEKPNVDEHITKFENETSNKSKKSNIEIKNLLNNIFNQNHPPHVKKIYIKRWQKLREFLLKYPTINEDELINIEDNNIANSLYTKYKEPINAYSFSQTGDFEDTEVFLDENLKGKAKVSAERSNLTRLMKIPGLKNYFISKDYATDFIPKSMIMTPPLFISIYKGALGEAAGKYILESLIIDKGQNLRLVEMPTEHYEFFDFKVAGKPAYIDFKNWSKFTRENKDEEIKKIIKKAKETKAEYVAIINIIKEENPNIQDNGTIYNQDGLKIDLIKSLVEEDKKGLHYRNDIIDKIKNNIISLS